MLPIGGTVRIGSISLCFLGAAGVRCSQMTDNFSYKILLFDADETLFDFHRCEAEAFQSSLKKMGVEGPFEELLASYQEISREMWSAYERGQISKQSLREDRWRRLSQAHSLEISTRRVSELYLEELGSFGYLLPKAEQVCAELSKSFRMEIVTNGFDQVQRQRFHNSGLKPYFEALYSSEQCGSAKPQRAIFDYVLSALDSTDRSEILMIGDRLQSDILGGNNAGIATCWYNPSRQSNTTGIVPKFEINSLLELPKLLLSN